MTKKGVLIVVDGTDGSGKATQVEMLCQKLREMGVNHKKLDFPRYDKESSALVKMYLRGEFGSNPSDVNPYAASTFYAIDRFASFQQDWKEFYESGGVLIADRYTTSNAVHQASKLPGKSRQDYLDWLFDFEYNLLRIPKPDMVIYLDVPTEVTEKLMRKRENDTNTKADIHEQDHDYLVKCRENAKEVVHTCDWNVINCADVDMNMRTVNDIHSEIFELTKEFFV